MGEQTSLGASYALLVDWNADGVLEADIISDLIEARPGRGRDSQLEASQISQMELDLANPHRKYSPANTSSPLYPNVKPGRRIQLRCTLGGTTHQLWYGRIKEITPQIGRAEQTCRLLCVDDLERLSYKQLTSPLYVGKSTARVVNEILTLALGTSFARSLAATRDILPFAWFTHQGLLNALQELAEAEGGMFFMSGAGAFTYYDRNWRTRATAGRVSQASLADGDYASIDYTISSDGIINTARITAQPRRLGALGNLWTAPRHITLTPGQQYRIWAHYGGPASGVRVPVAGTDYKAVDKAHTSRVLTSSLTVTLTNFAESGLLVLKNIHPSKTLKVTLLRLRGRQVIDLPSVTRSASDAASRSNYGEREIGRQPRLLSNPTLAQSVANYLVRHYKEPRARLTVRIQGRTGAMLQMILARGLWERVQVQNSSLGVNDPFWIERISHRIAPGRELHEVTWELTAVRDSDYWRLGTTSLGAAVVAR